MLPSVPDAKYHIIIIIIIIIIIKDIIIIIIIIIIIKDVIKYQLPKLSIHRKQNLFFSPLLSLLF